MQDLQNSREFENPFSFSKDNGHLADDASIWNLFKSGNESAFIKIYESNFDRLYAYGLRITKDKDLVKDSIQDLFIELRKGRNNLGNTDNIKFYLFKCLKRKIIKESGKWYSNLEDINDNYFFSFNFSHEHHLINRQIDEEQVMKLDLAVKKLSPRKKEVIYYFFYEGLSYQQIQEIMGLENIKSARNLIYKALDFLREVLK
ncbi:RNA polymerase sigma factor [Aquiflexum gelatinilyticum]|uniref:Sigma-70 family RNA polymerase sigma factor n=1 Tax=Aquiflexum gelatinilyticum TaxID=2961943 RepID=A0A9X2P4M2_9BACT|nr:sigma-70 family RNA polymerase sigma factor [Aquiflexum gelatinilyticum]MCR9014128.1 sigma-70 family RNA polymerase sigma factor [Aquiflexum gelatinilyticum]MCS4433177.1 sigma-70 family RNA polymerase sigma factor [Aquiflexum gelatinilyticum]